MKTIMLLAALGFALSGCQPPGDGGELTAEEADAFARGAQPLEVAKDVAGLADIFLALDEAIEHFDATAFAARIQARLEGLLSEGGATIGCGTISLDGTTVTVDFGTGCKLVEGLKLSGSASAGVTLSDATITVALTFTDFAVNGKALSGTVSFATSSGTSYTVNGNLTTAGITVRAIDLTLGTTFGDGIIIGGVLKSTQLGVTTTLTFHSVVWKLAECYPHSGSAQTKTGLIAQTIVFDARTPQTGMVTIKILGISRRKQLPAYGNCPPAADGGA